MKLREQIAAKLAAKKTKTEIAAVEIAQTIKKIGGMTWTTKKPSVDKGFAASLILDTADLTLADAMKLKAKFNGGDYDVSVAKRVKGKAYFEIMLFGSSGKGKDTTASLTARLTKELESALKNISPANSKDPAVNKTAAPTKAATAAKAGKAPKGTGKLKSFMKENGIDLKTLKALVKHITPSK